jgi:hypothetical protein
VDHLKTRPFDYWTEVYHSNTKLIQYSDGDCIQGIKSTFHFKMYLRPEHSEYLLRPIHGESLIKVMVTSSENKRIPHHF